MARVCEIDRLRPIGRIDSTIASDGFDCLIKRVCWIAYDSPRLPDFRDYSHIAQLIYGYWSVIFIPLAARLNLNPPDCECTLMTTPFSFLR